jgi:hypothetical protein
VFVGSESRLHHLHGEVGVLAGRGGLVVVSATIVVNHNGIDFLIGVRDGFVLELE